MSRRAPIWSLLALAIGCGPIGPGPGDAGDGGSGGQWEAELQRCVDVTNGYREQIGVAAYARSAELETYAAAGAAYDAEHPTPDHAHFRLDMGGGVAMAENELPGWPLASYGSVQGVVEAGLASMWAEAPPQRTGHHDNMASSQYQHLGCGIHVSAENYVWVVQDFN
jgi:uncharacterized protein YkwD